MHMRKRERVYGIAVTRFFQDIWWQVRAQREMDLLHQVRFTSSTGNHILFLYTDNHYELPSLESVFTIDV